MKTTEERPNTAPEESTSAPEEVTSPENSPAPETIPPQKTPSPRKPVPRWAKVLAGVAAAVVVLVGAGVLYVNGKLDLLRYSDGTISQMGTIDASEDQDLDGTGLVHNTDEMEMPEGSPFADEDVLNILLIGTDERTEAVNDADAFTHLNQLDGTEDTTEFSEDARADTLILVSLDIRDHIIRLVSIERGTGVPILLDGYEGEYDWITHTFRYGGAKLAMDTVEDCFNIQVDHYVRVNFNSFVQIVDAVGGVDINITELEAKALNWEVPSNSMLIVNKVDPGLNHFDGYTALQYARLRKIDNDWKRIERQRTVIQAVLDQVKNASVVELDNLLNTVLPLVQTNFTKSEIAALLVQLPGFLGAEVQQLSMPLQGTYGVRTGMDDRLMYDPDWAVNIKALQDFLYNDATAEEVIAATPETAAAEAARATAETAETAEEETSAWDRERDPEEEYLRSNMHTVDLAYPLSDTDFGSSDYRLFLAGLGGSRDTDVQHTLVEYLAGQGVRVITVPGGPAAGLLLDDYLQTGSTASLNNYLATLPEAQRAEAQALWQSLYARYPGRLHAAGTGTGKTTAAVANALRLLARGNYTTPEEEIADAVSALRGGNTRNALYWFRQAMAESPDAMEAFFGEDYPTVERLYAELNGTLEADGQDLVAEDLQRVLEAYPDAQVLAFVEGAQALQLEDSLGQQMQKLLQRDREQVCSIAVTYGSWGYDETFTPADSQDVWNPEGLGSRLGAYATPGKDLLLALDGEDCPLDEGDALLTEETDVTRAVQKLLILDEDNKIAVATSENAGPALAW